MDCVRRVVLRDKVPDYLERFDSVLELLAFSHRVDLHHKSDTWFAYVDRVRTWNMIVLSRTGRSQSPTQSRVRGDLPNEI